MAFTPNQIKPVRHNKLQVISSDMCNLDNIKIVFSASVLLTLGLNSCDCVFFSTT